MFVAKVRVKPQADQDQGDNFTGFYRRAREDQPWDVQDQPEIYSEATIIKSQPTIGIDRSTKEMRKFKTNVGKFGLW